ncbi:hypothetical protein ACMATS_14565 [Streptoverticillium reticulum]|uniref:hypothetical protein n=1 Tax=Streptoverticillium reticulum TaxID=1433415 RepID=UPI0039BFA141
MVISPDKWRECWGLADRTVTAFKNALAAAGIPESAHGSIRPVVTHDGKVYVETLMLRADAAATVAEALDCHRQS